MTMTVAGDVRDPMTGLVPGTREEDLVRAALGTLPRSDQQVLGRLYLRGLLEFGERRTISRIADRAGSEQVGQSLHHFISKSPWGWEPMRAELARMTQSELPPEAWVVDPVVIPKTGDHSVGVDVSFVPEMGRQANHQRALGLWFASRRGTVPVHWRLMLPGRWSSDRSLRRKAGIREDVEPDVLDAAVGLVREVGSEWGLPARPTVMDGRGYEIEGLLHRLAGTETPYVIRVADTARFVGLHPVAVRYGTAPAPARRLVELVKGLRAPVELRGSDGTPVSCLTLATPVVPAYGSAGAAAPRPLTLVGAWCSESGKEPSLWISNLPGVSARSVLSLGLLLDGVRSPAADLLGASAIRDFEGRSFAGWHHHATLVSLSCAIRALSPEEGTGPLPAKAPKYRGEPLCVS